MTASFVLYTVRWPIWLVATVFIFFRGVIIMFFSAEKHYTPLLIQGDTACVIVHTLLGSPCPINRSGDLLILLPPCGIGCSPAGSSKCLLALVSVGYLWWPVSPLILRFLPRLRQVPLSPQPSTRNSGKV